MPEAPHYAELHAISNFTFGRGASHPEELAGRAAELGYTALALTDECSLAGVVRAHGVCREQALALIIGSELCLADGTGIVLLATSRAGYGNLCQLITRGRRAADKGAYHLERDDVAALAGDCLCLYRVPADPDAPAAAGDAGWCAEVFGGRTFVAADRRFDGADRRRLAGARRIAAATGVEPVAVGNIHLHDRRRQMLQDTLTAIRLGVEVAGAGTRLARNAEWFLKDRAALARLYPADMLARSVEIASGCRFSLDELRYRYPAELIPAGLDAAAHLKALTGAGARRRWPDGIPARVRRLIGHELELIEELQYEHYFLTVHDIVRFARGRGILCQGRGSAANSAVCYCLGITEVDPARVDLLFERFISKERNEPPDIDVDFEHERREEVIQYIYGKFGRHRAALTATVITYRARSAIRDVGKALGMGLEQVDRLAGNLSWWDGREIRPERLAEAGFDPANPVLGRVLERTNELIGFPRHLSQHTGGFVISEQPLERMVPIENAAMAERTVIQWDKDDIDAVGLLKVDCLGLGMLSAIRKAFDLVNRFEGRSGAGALAMDSVPAEDPAVYGMIQRADTIGVFQIESRAQMAMLPRLKPASFYDLVIEVAIVRPGPIQGDMVHPYLRRRDGLEPVSYPSEAVKAVLERTLGVPIFQEQVIRLAMVAAGFSPGEADGLRRSMAAWRRRGGLEHYERRLIDGMRTRGYDEDFARRIFNQILGFGEYGFPESHAASFSLLVYVSAWLKHHHPAAFCAAIINSQPMGFYAPSQLVQDARRHGVEVRPVDVTTSDFDLTLERATGGDPAIRLGLRLVKGLTRAGAERLVTARRQRPFTDLTDLGHRSALNQADLDALAAADALASLAGHRHRAHWQAAGVEPAMPVIPEPRFSEGRPLLATPTEGQSVARDYAATGLTLRRHPLALLRPRLARLGISSSRDIHERRHGTLAHAAGLVITRQRPASANNVAFLTLEDEFGCVNVIVWQQLAERQRRELIGARLLGVHGEIQREGDVLHLIARRLEDHSAKLGALHVPSRDFR